MPSWKIATPNSASTMSGVPATISMLDSTTRASVWRTRPTCPYSATQIALATASGKASAIPIAVSSSVPIRGSRMPPVWACEVLIEGRVTSRLGVRYSIPR